MEAAVRWSPLSTDDYKRFLLVDVAGNSLTLYRADSLNKAHVQYHPVAHREKVPNFTAFDWSRTDDSLVALGLSSGEASLVKIEPGRPQTEPLRNFSIKTQRKCNTITFSADNLLAVGLDRVRHDHCLTVYDINAKEPQSKLCVSEAVTSVRFFPHQRHELLAAVNRMTIRLYDLRESASSTAGIGTFGNTKLVNNIAIDPLDENYFASGGSSGDPSVTIWDKRFLNRSPGTPNPDNATNSAVLELRPATDNSQTTSVWSIRYSGLKRGRFCLLSSTGEVKIYETSHHQLNAPSRAPPANYYGGSQWNSNHYVSKTHNLRSPLHNTQLKRHDNSRVIAFDWLSEGGPDGQGMLALHPDRKVDVIYAPNPAHVNMTARDDLALCREDVLLYAPSARKKTVSEEVASIHRSKAQDSTRDDEVDRAMANSLTARNKPLDQQSLKALNGSITTAAARTEKWLDDEVGLPPKIVRQDQFTDSLTLITIQRRRCEEDYLFDCKRNAEIVAEDPALVKLWSIIGKLEDLARDDGMMSESLDLSFLGINAIWEGRLGNSLNRVVSSRSLMPARFEDAVNGVLETHDLPHFQGPETEKPDQRQLSLAICGAVFSKEDAKERCDQLRENHQYYKAVTTAMFHGYKSLSLEILRDLIRGKVIQNTGLGALIASDRLNDEQREMCAWLEEDATDPYLQAILVYLGTGKWIHVVNKLELELDLSDRLIIAFMHLDDYQISTLVERITRSYTAAGNVEGVLLTGLTEQAVDLFQAYIRQTNDLQTAVLATAFTNPLYVDDIRWELWKETYFMQMQSWRAFIPRTKFTMQHSRRSVSKGGHKLIRPPPRQLTLRCAHCQGSIAKNVDGVLASASSPTKPGAINAADTTRTRITGPAASAGTVCPRCGSHLPRCALCMQWLGTPEPTRAKDIDKDVSGARENDVLSKFVTFCATCTHGFHAHHARTWFAKHAMCPVPDCRCLCGLRG